MTTSGEDPAPAGTFERAPVPVATARQGRAGLVAVVLLLAAGLFTLKGFLPALAWAAIFAIALWPWFERMASRFPKRRHDALPLTFVAGVLMLFVVPLAMIAVPLIGDAHAAGAWLAEARIYGVPPPAFLGSLPFGDRLVPLWQSELGQPGSIAAIETHTMHGHSFETVRLIGAKALHRLVLAGFMLLTLFFLLRDGDAVAHELRVGSRRAFGPAGEDVGRQMIRSVHGTVNGLVLVGLGEGLIMGIAYAIAGVPHPTLFGLMTAVLAMVPFGAPLAFIAAGLVLAASSKAAAAAGVVALGVVVTFVADHFVRPVLIGGATRLPFIWVLLGILGGVEAWGLVGLFLGPAIMAALILLWREWVGSQRGLLNPVRDSTQSD